MTPQLERALELLEDEANQLDRWAEESKSGGWSTHQVRPMLMRADFLRRQTAQLRTEQAARRVAGW